MPTAVLLGDINVDLLLSVPAYPQEGGEAIASQQIQQLGGSANNTAICLAKLGITARMIGRVGSDAVGDSAIADMTAVGVDTSWISRDPVEPTQLNIVLVSASGERTMFAYRGANARLSPEQIDAAVLEGADLVHLSGYSLLQAPQRDAAIKLIELARVAKIPVTLDIPAGVAAEIGPWALKYAADFDTVLLGETDIAQLKLTSSSDLLELGIRQAVVKHGARGCTLVSGNASSLIPGIAVEVVDTTGAGDAMAAGVIAGQLTGLSAPESCQLGAALGAITVTRPGAGLNMPAKIDVQSLLESSASLEGYKGQVLSWASAS